MTHQEPLPGFDADPAEDEELRAVQFWGTAILSDLVLATLDALRSQADKADPDTLRPPFSIELRLPAKTLSLDFPFESSAYEKYPEESLLRLLFTYDPSEAPADMDRLGPEYRDQAARMREQVSAVTERIIREKAKEDPELAAKLTAEVRRGMDQAGEAVNKLIADNIRKAESERLRGTSRTIILVSEGEEEPAYPCTLEGFRETIRQLSYPPPVEYTHPAGMMLERMRKERNTSFELAFTATPDPNEPGPGITSGKLTIELVPLVLDVSRRLVNLDDFPTTDATPADMEKIESQLDALKDQDHWKGLLSICTAYFPILATIETDPPNLHEITTEQRAAFWQALLDAADRHFSDNLKQYAPKDQAATPARSRRRKRKLSTHKPTTTDGKRPYPVTASLLGASDPQLWLSFATPKETTLEDTNVAALIGNLPVTQQRVFRAVQTHISRTNFKTPVLHFPNGFKDLAELCHVSTSGKEYQELTTAFMQLAYTPVHLYWNFNKSYFDFTGTLWQVTRGFEDLTPSQKKKLRENVTAGKPLPRGILQRKHEIIYQPAAILMQAGHYYRELPDTETQIKAVHGGKKRLAYLDPFLRLIDIEYFNRRPKDGRKGIWTVGPITLEHLCRMCGMGNMFTQRRPGRAFDTARKLAEIAVTMHRLKSFDFDNTDAAFMTLDHATLEQAYPERRPRNGQALPAPAASPIPAKADKKTKPKRPLTEAEETDARGLFDACAKLLRETLPAEFQAQGFTVQNASLSDEHVREVLRIIIRPYLFHAGGFEPQLSEVWLLGKEDKGGLRYLCKQIPARAAKAAEKDGRRKKSITRLSGYLLSEQKKTGRNLIEREMTALSDEIPEQTKRYRQKNLEGQGADALAKHAGMTRRVKALALSLGLDWPEH